MEPFNNNTSRYSQMMATFICALAFLIIPLAQPSAGVSFKGIPAAFGDLDLNKRTDIVVISEDGKKVDIYYQHQRQVEPPLELGFSCRSDYPIVQVYLTDIDNDGYPNLLPLILEQDGLFSLKSLKVKTFDPFNNYPYPNTKLSANTAYSLLVNAAALKSDATNSSSTTVAAVAEPLKSPSCEFLDLDVRMKSQPLLFDLKGELKTDFMSLDKDGAVAVWRNHNNAEKPIVRDTQDWSFIPREYFKDPHSNAFIDMNHDHAADIVLSSLEGKVAYLYANKDKNKSFREINKELNNRSNSQNYRYGQSSLVDIDADGKIDHVLPRCHKDNGKCEMIVLYDNSRIEIIFNFTRQTEANYSYDYSLDQQTFATNYLFPITLRAADLDGDGYTDFVIVAKSNKDSRSKLIFLHNIPNLETVTQSNIMGATTMTRTFDVMEIPPFNPNLDIHLVTLFDINEDGKIDLLIGECDKMNSPSDLNVTARMNSQMVDACFMKVLVTNGGSSETGNTNGQSAHGPFVCFELSQNDGRKLQGCSGQLSQASHFALQPPFVIFGLGQTPHFVETLNVSIPGFGPDGKVRTRLLEQIVPDAQVIIIPRDKDTPSSWDYKMFLSPMSDLVFSTLIALAVLCLIILFIIFILHRQETLEDAAEHEEYKRHWPESR